MQTTAESPSSTLLIPQLGVGYKECERAKMQGLARGCSQFLPSRLKPESISIDNANNFCITMSRGAHLDSSKQPLTWAGSPVERGSGRKTKARPCTGAHCSDPSSSCSREPAGELAGMHASGAIRWPGTSTLLLRTGRGAEGRVCGSRAATPTQGTCTPRPTAHSASCSSPQMPDAQLESCVEDSAAIGRAQAGGQASTR